MPKRTKNIKQTDIDSGKAWLRKKRASIRKYPIIEPRKTLLIVGEGQTEQLYFESFNSKSLPIKSVGLGCSTMELVECAIDLAKGEPYDEVWVIFDMDYSPEKPNTQYANFDNSIEKAKANNIKVAYSNDCFELWFYLHYSYTEQQHHRTFYYQKLGAFWDINYEREGKKRDFSKKIRELLQQDSKADSSEAVKRSEKLFKKNNDLPYHQQNPVTLVYELYEMLRKQSSDF